MRLSTSGSVPRVDLTLLIEALVALREEWAALQIGPDGTVVNPISGEPNDALRLVEGRHRRAGAVYETLLRTPVMAPDPHRLRILDTEMLTGQDVDWAEYHRRRDEISTPTGEVTESRSRFTLRGDDARVLALTVNDLRSVWSVDVDIVHGRLPRVDLTAQADATAMMAAEGVPGWLSRRLGGPATASATIDLSTLERRRGGTLGEGSGRFNRFKGSGSATVAASPASWTITVDAKIRGKGLGRIALRFLGGRLRRSWDSAASACWTRVPDSVAGLEQMLLEARRVADGEGGVGRAIHRGLWDPTFSDHLAAAYGLE